MERLTRALLPWILLAILAFHAPPAWANQPPGPTSLLTLWAILPLMAFFTWVSGGYRLLPRKYGMTRATIALAVLICLCSLAYDGLPTFASFIFGIYSLQRSILLLRHAMGPTGGDPQTGSPPRRWLLAAAGVANCFTLMALCWTSAAFVGWWPNEEGRLDCVRRTAAIQLAWARSQEEEGLPIRYLDPTRSEEWPWSLCASNLQMEVTASDFRIWLPPSRFPLFPYRFLVSQPSFYADSSGEIRAARVHSTEARCPSDAPVVARVQDEDIRKAGHEVLPLHEAPAPVLPGQSPQDR